MHSHFAEAELLDQVFAGQRVHLTSLLVACLKKPGKQALNENKNSSLKIAVFSLEEFKITRTMIVIQFIAGQAQATVGQT